MENSPRTYQYSECGLDYVYLVGGFEIQPSAYGDQLAISNQKGLHRAIWKYLITRKKELTGREVRFLRHEMDMSQPTLAKLLGVTEQTVHKWEMGKTAQVPETASRMIRVIYGESIGEKSPVRQVLRKISDLENELDELVTFIEKEQAWRQTRMKAA